MDEEARRFDVELLADVLADQNQVPSALAAGTGLGFVAMLDARLLDDRTMGDIGRKAAVEKRGGAN